MLQFFKVRFVFLLISFIFCSDSFCQKQNNIWYFGVHNGINFNSGAPVVLTNSPLSAYEGVAAMCDNNGNLLFFTDGINVYNRNLKIMPNGKGLLGNVSTTQSALIVPKPGNDNIYYIFTAPAEDSITPLCYNIVDMTKDKGLGDITSKNIPLHTSVTERLTGTIKNNCMDYWVVSQNYGDNAFLSFSVTSSGVDPTPVVSYSGPLINYSNGGIYADAQGYMKISPDGSKIAYANSDGYTSYSQLFDFDNSTGLVSNNIPLRDSLGYGLEFSPDSSKLYIATQNNPLIITQYNLAAGSASQIQNSAIQVVNKYFIRSSEYYTFGALELAPDNKIYISRFQGKFLSDIDNPNLSGTLCGYRDTSVIFNNECYLGLPNNIKKLSSSCFLPIILLNFTSSIINNSVKLQWQTAQEINSDYFSIERSNDAINYSSIGKVNAAGTSNSLKSYTFLDNNPQPINYYRLKEVDKDGKFMYSNTLLVKDADINSFTILQNPVQNVLQVQSNQTGSYIIYDFSGRRIETVVAHAGNQNINIASLSSGVYVLQLITSNGNVSSKVFEKK